MRPNWPLIGIIVGAIATVSIVVAIFVSTSMAPRQAALPTIAALPKLTSTTVQKTVSPALTDECAYAMIDGVKSFAIWPKNFTRDPSGDVIASDGSSYGEEDSFSATIINSTPTKVLALEGGGDDGYLGTLLSRCTDGGSHVTIITAIAG